ncbi:MAG: hemolysin family protein, partial [Rickettsiales bacterium]
MEPQAKKEQQSSESEDPGSSGDYAAFIAHPQKTSETAKRRENGGANTTAAPGFLKRLGVFLGMQDKVSGGNGQSNGNGLSSLESGSYSDAISLKEELGNLLEERSAAGEEEQIAPVERNMLENILNFGDMVVSDIMTPRTDIVAVEDTICFEELKALISEEQHSRMPVYKDSLDQIEGYIHIKDVAVQLCKGNRLHIADIMRKVLFVPPSMKIIDLLVQMRLSSVHIAIVVDEYGGTDGLVTMEDIVEEIVGEIQDEHDDEEVIDHFIWVGDNTIEAEARMEIEKLQECFDESVVLHEDEEDDDFDTIGGLVFSHLGYVPKTGESFDYPTGLHITVLEADPRSVKRVR